MNILSPLSSPLAIWFLPWRSVPIILWDFPPLFMESEVSSSSCSYPSNHFFSSLYSPHVTLTSSPCCFHHSLIILIIIWFHLHQYLTSGRPPANQRILSSTFWLVPLITSNLQTSCSCSMEQSVISGDSKWQSMICSDSKWQSVMRSDM